MAICLCTTYLCEVNTKTEGQKLKVTSAFLAKSKKFELKLNLVIKKNTETANDTLYISSVFYNFLPNVIFIVAFKNDSDAKFYVLLAYLQFFFNFFYNKVPKIFQNF